MNKLKQTKSAIKNIFVRHRVEPPWPSGRVRKFGGSGQYLTLPCSVALSKALSVPPKVQVTEKAMVPFRHESKLIY